jgi:predicted DNA-binding transcriptional regulator AlpA
MTTTTTKRKTAQPVESPRYLTIEMAATALHLSPKALYNRASAARRGEMPPLYKIGGRVLMVESEFHAWVKAQQVKARY